MKLLKFSSANTKLQKLEAKTGKRVFSLDLLSGHNCPGARDCLALALLKNGKTKIWQPKHAIFRCYSASQEARLRPVYNQRKANSDLIKNKSKKELIELITKSIPKKAQIIRVHSSGDFISQTYFDAWVEVAKKNPSILFYGYTKSLPFWIKRLKQIPSNFKFTASYGGKWDILIAKHNLRNATVVYNTEKQPIDYDDSQAALGTGNFFLLIHGTQGAGTEASKAVSKINRGIAV